MFKLLSFTFIDSYWLYADCEQQPGIALPTSLATSVSYPTSRATPALQQQQSAPAIKQQRLFTGTITKLHDNFGFVDEDVFFQTRWSLFSLAYFYFCKLDCYYCTLVAEYCDDHVCMSVLEHISGTMLTYMQTLPNFVYVTHGSGSSPPEVAVQ